MADLGTKLHANDTPQARLPRTKIVRWLLLQRIQNDLRCCIILVERGYALQAASLAAGIFEAWVTLGSIRTDEDAVRWLNHDDEENSFGKIGRLTEIALKEYGHDGDYEKYYGQYRQNPILGYKYEIETNSLQFCPGPDISEGAIRMG